MDHFVELQTPFEQTSLLNAEKFWFYQAGLEQGCSMFVSYNFLPCKQDGKLLQTRSQTVACKIQPNMLWTNIAWPERDTYHASPSLSEKVTYE